MSLRGKYRWLEYSLFDSNFDLVVSTWNGNPFFSFLFFIQIEFFGILLVNTFVFEKNKIMEWNLMHFNNSKNKEAIKIIINVIFLMPLLLVDIH